MAETPDIPNDAVRGPEPPPGDYQGFRSLGLDALIKTGSNFWTDFNEHDPGITMMETMAYAITDLLYRSEFPVEDLLSPSPETNAPPLSDQFLTPRQALPTSPVNLNDLRKIIIDQDGVRNAWVVPTGHFYPLKGLWEIYVDLEDQVFESAQNEKNSAKRQELIAQIGLNHKESIKKAFLRNRPLGEDIFALKILKPLFVSMKLTLRLESSAAPENVVAEMFYQIGNRFRGRVEFRTLENQLADFDGRPELAFEGPALLHGFLSDKELLPKAEQISGGELSRMIKEITGVITTTEMILYFSENGKNAQTLEDHKGVISIRRDQRLELLPPELQNVTVFQGNIPYAVDMTLVTQLLKEKLARQRDEQLFAAERDIALPTGRFRNLQRYFSIQYDLPVIYGLKPGSLPSSATDRRRAEVLQLSGFLTLFDQVLKNYLSQIAHLGNLFAWNSQEKHTYFTGGLENAVHRIRDLFDFYPPSGENLHSELRTPDEENIEEVLQAATEKYRTFVQEKWENKTDFLNRRNKFLTHMLARFGRNLENYRIGLQKGQGKGAEILTKERFLQNISKLSAEKAQGWDYSKSKYDPEALSGLKKSIEALFGMEPQTSENYQVLKRFEMVDNETLTDVDYHATNKYALVSLPHDKDSEAPRESLDLAKLLKLSLLKENIRVLASKDGNPGYVLEVFETPRPGAKTELAQFGTLNQFPTEKLAEEAKEDLYQMLRKFDKKSERIYLLDHVLFRPSHDQEEFNLTIQWENGEEALKSETWESMSTIELLKQFPQHFTPPVLVKAKEDESATSEAVTPSPLENESTPEFKFTIEELDFSLDIAGTPPPFGSPDFLQNGKSRLKARLQSEYKDILTHPEALGKSVQENEQGLPPQLKKADPIDLGRLLQKEVLGMEINAGAEEETLDTWLETSEKQRTGKWLSEEYAESLSSPQNLAEALVENLIRSEARFPALSSKAFFRNYLAHAMESSSFSLELLGRYLFGLLPPEQVSDLQKTLWRIRLHFQYGKAHMSLVCPEFSPSEEEAKLKADSIAKLIQKGLKNNAFGSIFLPRIKPVSSPGWAPADHPLLSDPYSGTVTILAPDWPTRFSDLGFRTLLENAIREEAPAHLLVNIFWLNKPWMQEFEWLLNEWEKYASSRSESQIQAKKLMRALIRYIFPPLVSTPQHD